jgi:hypothetical protein
VFHKTVHPLVDGNPSLRKPSFHMTTVTTPRRGCRRVNLFATSLTNHLTQPQRCLPTLSCVCRPSRWIADGGCAGIVLEERLAISSTMMPCSLPTTRKNNPGLLRATPRLYLQVAQNKLLVSADLYANSTPYLTK